MSVEKNKAIVRRLFEEVHNKRNLDVIEEVFAPVCVNHGPGGDSETSTDHYREGAAEIAAAAPDVHDEIINMMAEGDKVGVLFARQETFTNQFRNLPPTGVKASIWGYQLCRIEDGKIVEQWSVFDTVAIQKFLGTYPGA